MHHGYGNQKQHRCSLTEDQSSPASSSGSAKRFQRWNSVQHSASPQHRRIQQLEEDSEIINNPTSTSFPSNSSSSSSLLMMMHRRPLTASSTSPNHKNHSDSNLQKHQNQTQCCSCLGQLQCSGSTPTMGAGRFDHSIAISNCSGSDGDTGYSEDHCCHQHQRNCSAGSSPPCSCSRSSSMFTTTVLNAKKKTSFSSNSSDPTTDDDDESRHHRHHRGRKYGGAGWADHESQKQTNTGRLFSCSPASLRLFAVVMAVGAGTTFMTALDSVVDNLQPLARNFFRQQMSLSGNNTTATGSGFDGGAAAADELWGWIVAARLYGIAAGCCAVPLLAGLFGGPSKQVLITFLGITLFGGMLSALIKTAPPWGIWLALLGRLLTGLGSGIGQVLGASLLAEIPPTSCRGTVLATQTVWACLGELFGLWVSLDSVIGSPECWHWALFAPTAIIPFALLILALSPDSPRALALVGEKKKSLAALHFYQTPEQWVETQREIRAELLHLQQCEEKGEKLGDEAYFRGFPLSSQSRTSSSVSLVLAPWATMPCSQPQHFKRKSSTGAGSLVSLTAVSFTRPLALALFVLTFVHLDDWLWISYSTDVFQREAGMGARTASKASLWMIVPQVVVSIGLIPLVERFPRRALLIVATVLSILCAIVVALISASTTKESIPFIGGVNKALALPIIAAVDLCASAIASESAYTVVPELFAQRDRVLGTAFAGISQNLFGAALTMAFPVMMNHFGGLTAALGALACMNVVYVLLVVWVLPETRGVSFSEISSRLARNRAQSSPQLNSMPDKVLISTKGGSEAKSLPWWRRPVSAGKRAWRRLQLRWRRCCGGGQRLLGCAVVVILCSSLALFALLLVTFLTSETPSSPASPGETPMERVLAFSETEHPKLGNDKDIFADFVGADEE